MSDDVDKALTMALRIRALIDELTPAAQGAVVAQLLAYWLVQHPNLVREEILLAHIRSVRRMMIDLEKEQYDA